VRLHEDARVYCRTFFAWHNDEHRRSGIGFMTPHSLDFGKAEAIHLDRQTALDDAFLDHPERFKQRKPQLPTLPMAALINPPKKEYIIDVTTPLCTMNPWHRVAQSH